MSDLANIEALTNIAANAAEIFGIAAGGPLLLFSFIPHSSGLQKIYCRFESPVLYTVRLVDCLYLGVHSRENV